MIIILGTVSKRCYRQAILVKKEGGRGLASNGDSVDTTIRRLEDYSKWAKRLITATRNSSDCVKTNRTK